MKTILFYLHPILFLLYILIPVSGYTQAVVVPQNGHSGEVKRAVYSPDAQFLYTIGDDGMVLCWDLNTSRHLAPLSGMEPFEKAENLFFISESQFLVVSNTTRLYLGNTLSTEMKLFDDPGFKMRESIACYDGNTFLAFHQGASGRFKLVFYFPHKEKDARLSTSKSAEKVILGNITCMFHDPESMKLFVGDDQGGVYTVNLITLKCDLLKQFKKTEIKKISVLGKQALLLVSGKKKLLYSMEMNIDKSSVTKLKLLKKNARVVFIEPLKSQRGFALGETIENTYSTGLRYVSGAADYKSAPLIWFGRHNQPVNITAVSPVGGFLAMFPYFSRYIIFSTGMKMVVQELHKPATEISDFLWDENGKKMYVFCSSTRSVRVADLEKAEFRSIRLPFKRESSHCFFPDGTFFIEDNFRRKLYRVSPSGNIDSMENPFGLVDDFKPSPNGKLILSAGKNNNILILDADRMTVKHDVPYKLGMLTGQYSFSSDGGAFYYYNIGFGTDDTIYIRNTETGNLLMSLIKENLLADSFLTVGEFDVRMAEGLLLMGTTEIDLEKDQRFYKLVITPLDSTSKILKYMEIPGQVVSFESGRNNHEVFIQLEKKNKEFITGFLDLRTLEFKLVDRTGGSKIEHLQWAGDDRFWQFHNVSSYVFRGMGGDLGLVDLNTGQIQYSLVMNDNGYALYSESGEMLCTKGSSDLVAFQFQQDEGVRVVPGSTYEAEYNRPHEVLEKLNSSNANLIGVYEQAYNKRLKKLGNQGFKTESVAQLPHCRVKLIGGSLVTYQNVHTFNLSYASLVPLKAVHMVQNGCPANGTSGFAITGNARFDSDFKVTVTLVPGINRIAFYVQDTAGNRSIPDYKEIYLTTDDVDPVTYYIGIGVSHYADSVYNLHYAAKDIRDVSYWAGKKADVMVDTFLDERALWDSISTVREKLRELKPWDKVIISFSGHGVLSKDLELYLGLHKMDFGNPEVGGLLLDSLVGLLDQTPALQKLLLLDACHSGEIDKEGRVVFAADSIVSGTRGSNIVVKKKDQKMDAFEFMKNHFEDAVNRNGAVVISAAGGEEYALEMRDLKNGVFTYALLKCLESSAGDENLDGEVSISELKKYLMKTVPEMTGNRQKPTMRNENAVNDWEL